MSYKVDSILSFEKEAKRLKRNFPSLKFEISKLIDQLEINPVQGSTLSKGFFKIRLAIKSKGIGKSGRARVITLLK